MQAQHSRTEFLMRAGALLAGAFLVGPHIGDAREHAHGAHGAHDEPAHPEPRDGITNKDVLPVEKLGSSPRKKVLEAYEAARNQPALLDGILCTCSCGGRRGTHRSLLVCFETAQATGCGECQEEGIFVGRLARDGKNLDEIRVAFDKEFG